MNVMTILLTKQKRKDGNFDTERLKMAGNVQFVTQF